MTGGSSSPTERRSRRGGLRARVLDKGQEDDKKASMSAGAGGIFKSAAVAVLRHTRRLLTTGEITKYGVELGYLKCSGKTPEATMASALYTDVKRKLQKSVFTRPQEGLFGLREWIEEGYYPEGWVGPPDGLGLAPFKRRNSGGQKSRTTPRRLSKARASRTWRANSEDEDPEHDEEQGEAEESDEAEELEEEGMDDDGLDDKQSTEQPSRSYSQVKRPRSSRSTLMEKDSNPEDDCLSPLHVLGDAALMSNTSDMDMREQHHIMQGGSSLAMNAMLQANNKRKRPNHIQVPLGSMPLASRMEGVGGMSGFTPKSPYEDSLAALHEIATSPATFAPGPLLGGLDKERKRPRLSVDTNAPTGQHDDVPQGHMGLTSLGTPLSLLLDMPGLAPMPGSTPGILLQTSPLMTAAGQAIALLKPGVLGSPGAGLLTSLDGSSALVVPLPERLPSPGDMIKAQHMGGKAALLNFPGYGPYAAAAAMRQGDPSIPGMLGLPPRHPLHGQPHLRPPMPLAINPMRSAGSLPSGPPSGRVGSDTDPASEIARVQQVVERLEGKLGTSNPQVGKAWLALARMYQHMGSSSGAHGSEKAAAALQRAWAVCRNCAEGCGASVTCGDAFAYLMERVQQSQMQQTAAAEGTAV